MLSGTSSEERSEAAIKKNGDFQFWRLPRFARNDGEF
jgi:hypothetical protein